jgi:hypothetical protein
MSGLLDDWGKARSRFSINPKIHQSINPAAPKSINPIEPL